MATMSGLAPLAMSQTKEDLLKHLNLPLETYALMAKETDRVYNWLTSQKSHLKDNCKRKPPYDWSDIQEKSKDEAMRQIATGGDLYTDYYWKLATYGDGDCPNWVARWFLYHKFRYRDGRNRAQKNEKHNDNKHGSSSKQKHSSRGGGGEVEYNYDYDGMNAGSSAQGYPLPGASASSYYDDGQYQYDTPTQDAAPSDNSQSATYYDPVRDV